MSDPQRTQIFEAFYAEMESIVPPEDNTWRKKDKKPILRVTGVECPAFYVFDFQEQVIEESKQNNELVRAKLFIILEFWVQHTLSDSPSARLNAILWEVQQKFGASTLGGLAQSVSEVGSKFKMESAEERIVSAEVAYRVTYVRKMTNR